MRLLSARSGVRIPPRTPFYLYVPETVRKSGRFFFVLSCQAGDKVQLFVSRQPDYTQESRLRHAGMDKEPARKRTRPAHAENLVLFCGKQPVCIRRQSIPFPVSGQFDPMQVSVSLSEAALLQRHPLPSRTPWQQ